jgi:hypothetical protein
MDELVTLPTYFVANSWMVPDKGEGGREIHQADGFYTMV